MPLDKEDWESIYQAIEAAKQPSEVTYGIVIKRDVKHRLIWVSEFGEQPIPIVGFQASVTVYDVEPNNHITDMGLDVEETVTARHFQIDHVVPEIGDTVVIVRQFGGRRLPKCLGTVLSVDNYNPNDV